MAAAEEEEVAGGGPFDQADLTPPVAVAAAVVED